MDRWFYTERDAVRDYIKSTSKSLLYRHNKQAIVLRWYIHSNCYLVIIISWQSVYIWMNTNMEFKYFEFIKIIIYSLSLSLSRSLSLSQYIVYPKIFLECCTLWGDTICGTLWHILLPTTIYQGKKFIPATIYAFGRQCAERNGMNWHRRQYV